MKKKEEKEHDSFDIPIQPVVQLLIDVCIKIIRSSWKNKQFELQPLKQMNDQNSGYSEPIILRPVKKER